MNAPRFAALALPFVLGGCVYFNSMYNTRHFAAEAEKAEREGRTMEASTNWGQVAVKAETLIARHPNSKYVPEAQVLRGRAYAHLDDCAKARVPLQTGIATVADSSLASRGLLALARCEAALREPRLAISAYERLLAGATAPDSLKVEFSEALRMAGMNDSAARVMARVGPGFLRQRLMALAAAGETAQVDSLVRAALLRQDSLPYWDTVVSTLARRDVNGASAVLDVASGLPGVPPRRVGVALIEDGRRLGPTSPDRAAARFRRAASMDSIALGPLARLAALRAALLTVNSREGVVRLIEQATRDTASPELAGELPPLLRNLEWILAATAPDTALSAPDVRWFYAAERARDAAGAPALAAALFRAHPVRFPDSPYAAKALLALRALEPGGSYADSLLRARYAGSPYAVAARGADAPGLVQLEDSLAAFARTLLKGDSLPDPTAQPPRRPGQRPGVRPAGAEPL